MDELRDDAGDVFGFMLPEAEFEIVFNELELSALIAEAEQVGVPPIEHILVTLLELYLAMENPSYIYSEEQVRMGFLNGRSVAELSADDIRRIIRGSRERAEGESG